MNKIFVVMTVARQLMGEIIFIRSEKGFKDRQKAEDFAKTLSGVTQENIAVPNVGNVLCATERGIYAIEIED